MTTKELVSGQLRQGRRPRAQAGSVQVGGGRNREPVKGLLGSGEGKQTRHISKTTAEPRDATGRPRCPVFRTDLLSTADRFLRVSAAVSGKDGDLGSE